MVIFERKFLKEIIKENERRMELRRGISILFFIREILQTLCFKENFNENGIKKQNENVKFLFILRISS